MKKLFLWAAMLSKRLYKKPSFLAILILIPILVLGYSAISAGQSGVLTIGLVVQKEDPISRQICEDLQSSQLLSFRLYTDPDTAQTLLRAGKLDAVWLFPENMAEKLEKFAQNPTSANAFIKVLEREDNIALMLVREKLNATVYPYVAQRVYVHFLRELAPELDHLSDDALLAYYQNGNFSQELFDLKSTSGATTPQSYLLSPLRGLLGTLILLCSLASGMYYIRDAQTGTFAWVSQRHRYLPELGCQLAASLHIAAVCFACLALSGLSGKPHLEILLLPMYSLCCSAFGMLLRRLCGSIQVLGTLLPLIIILTLVICPVFFDLGALRQLQYLLPPTYYINAVYNPGYLGSMVLYTGSCFGLYFLAGKCLKAFQLRP